LLSCQRSTELKRGSAAATAAIGRSSRVGKAAVGAAYGSVWSSAHYTCNDDTLSTACTSYNGVPDHRRLNGLGGNLPTVYNGEVEAPATNAASGVEVVLMEQVIYRQPLSDMTVAIHSCYSCSDS
jgi:hypothetical protein